MPKKTPTEKADIACSTVESVLKEIYTLALVFNGETPTDARTAAALIVEDSELPSLIYNLVMEEK